MNYFDIKLDKNTLHIYGNINFINLVNVVNTCINKTEHLEKINVDLLNLHDSNSAALIFIVNLIRSAIKKNQIIKFINMPTLLNELSKVYNLNNIIQKI